MNGELWIAVSKLQVRIARLEELYESLTDRKDYDEYVALKEEVDSFMSHYHRKGEIPSDPRTALVEGVNGIMTQLESQVRELFQLAGLVDHVFLCGDHWWDERTGYKKHYQLLVGDLSSGEVEEKARKQIHDWDKKVSESRARDAARKGDCRELRVAAVAAGAWHNLQLNLNGGIVGTGSNEYEQAESFGGGVVSGGAARNQGENLYHRPHENAVTHLAWSPDGTRLVSGDRVAFKVWEIASGKRVCELQGHSVEPFCLRWSPDGTRVATGCSDKSVKIWNAASGYLNHSLPGHEGKVRGLTWSPDGKCIASVAEDCTIRIIDSVKGKLLRTVELDVGALSLDWSPDGKHLATLSSDGVVALWDVTVQGLAQELARKLYKANDQPVLSFAIKCKRELGRLGEIKWSPDGSRIYAGTSKRFTIFDVENKTEQFSTDPGWRPFGWSPDSSTLARYCEGKRGKVVFCYVGLSHDSCHKKQRWESEQNLLLIDESWKNVSCPNGHGLLRSWGRKLRCWKCGWNTGEGDAYEHKYCPCVLSPEGAYVAVGDRQGRVWFYDSVEGKLTEFYKGQAICLEAKIKSISGGGFHSLYLFRDGLVNGRGHNDFGQATPPKGLFRATAISAGGWHSLALLEDGTVAGWGRNDFGQSTVPEGLRGVTAIAAGHEHNLALLQDGTVKAWGNNNHGQAEPPEDLKHVVAVTAGYNHSLALLQDGTVVGWGSNVDGQACPPTELITGNIHGNRQATAIAAGGSRSLALIQDGSVLEWGKGNKWGHTRRWFTPDDCEKLFQKEGRGYDPLLDRVHAISSGHRHSIVHLSKGSQVILHDEGPIKAEDFSLISMNPAAEGHEPMFCSRRKEGDGESPVDPLSKYFNEVIDSGDIHVAGKKWLNDFINNVRKSLGWQVPRSGNQVAPRQQDIPVSMILRLPKEDRQQLKLDGYPNKDLERAACLLELAQSKGPWYRHYEAKMISVSTQIQALRHADQYGETLGAVGVMLHNVALWNHDGVSPQEYNFIIACLWEWNLFLGTQLKNESIDSILVWALNQWEEDKNDGTRSNLERAIAQLAKHKTINDHDLMTVLNGNLNELAKLDGGVATGQAEFIDGLNSEIVKTRQACKEVAVIEDLPTNLESTAYILLTIALWDDDGLTELEQGSVRDTLNKFFPSLDLGKIVKTLESELLEYKKDVPEYMEKCLVRIRMSYDRNKKLQLMGELKALAVVGNNLPEQKKMGLQAISQKLGVEDG